MRLEDLLHEALLRGVDGLKRCRRCNIRWQVGEPGWRQSMLGDGGIVLTSCDLCPACVKDYEWFLASPPEYPSTSSGIVDQTAGGNQ